MGSITLGPFALSLDLALAFASIAIIFFVAKFAGRRYGIDPEPALWKILIASAVMSRIAFVLAYLDTYRQHPLSIVDIRDGGFMPSAGIATALAMAVWFAWRKKSWRMPLAFSLLAGACVWGGISAIVLLNDKARSMPQVVLTTLEGRSVPLDSLKGKPMVVNLWATWCPPCRREMPVLRDAQVREQDVVFVFANQGESADKIQKYLDSEGLSLGNVLLDPTGELARQIGSRAMPTTLFFDAKGRLADTRIGELSAATLMQRIDTLRSSR